MVYWSAHQFIGLVRGINLGNDSQEKIQSFELIEIVLSTLHFVEQD